MKDLSPGFSLFVFFFFLIAYVFCYFVFVVVVVVVVVVVDDLFVSLYQFLTIYFLIYLPGIIHLI